MVRWMLGERCRPDWSYVERLIEDFNQRLDEDATFLTEKLELGLWVRYLCYYCKWYFIIVLQLILSELSMSFSTRPSHVFIRNGKISLINIIT